jgi:hypothetical protein
MVVTLEQPRNSTSAAEVLRVKAGAESVGSTQAVKKDQDLGGLAQSTLQPGKRLRRALSLER